MIELARQYGRYGYRRVATLLCEAGWQVNDKRIERLWHREGLKVPQKQPKKGRLWRNDGSCIRLRAKYVNNVWSYDFVHHRTDDGQAPREIATEGFQFLCVLPNKQGAGALAHDHRDLYEQFHPRSSFCHRQPNAVH